MPRTVRGVAYVVQWYRNQALRFWVQRRRSRILIASSQPKTHRCMCSQAHIINTALCLDNHSYLSPPHFYHLPTMPVSRLLKRVNSFVGDCEGGAPQRSLMSVYRHFGLHQFSPSSLVPTYTCGDERFSRENMFGGAEKHFPRPMR